MGQGPDPAPPRPGPAPMSVAAGGAAIVANEEVARRAFRRAVPTLAVTQILGGVGVASGVAVGGILAQDLSGSTSLAGLTQTMSVMGGALLALPLARAATRSGRRVALATGYVVASVGAAVTLVAAVVQSFGLLLFAMLLFGGATASGLQARYAATDAAPATARARALSIVVWATTVGAVIGPNLSDAGAQIAGALRLPGLAGPFVFSLAAFVAAAVVLTLLLRPDPAACSPAALGRHVPLRQVFRAVRGPDAVLGLATVAVAHAVMVGSW